MSWEWSGRRGLQIRGEGSFQGDPCEVCLGVQGLFSPGRDGHGDTEGLRIPIAQRGGRALPCRCRGQTAHLGCFLWHRCPGWGWDSPAQMGPFQLSSGCFNVWLIYFADTQLNPRTAGVCISASAPSPPPKSPFATVEPHSHHCEKEMDKN